MNHDTSLSRWSPLVVLLPRGARLEIGLRIPFVTFYIRQACRARRWPDPLAILKVLFLGKTGDLP